MKNLFRLSACLIAGLALPAFAQDAEEGPDPSSVHIVGFTYGGTGCPVGSATSSLSPDQTVITVLFDAFVAQAGPGVALSESRKNCQLNVTLNVPQGWSYSLVKVDYRGYAYLDRGVTGTQKATYYFSGDRRSASAETTFRGPLDQDYHLRDVVPFESTVWSPCGETRAANINSQVRVNNAGNRKGAGMLTVDSIDGQVEQLYHLQWRRCTR